MKTVYSVTILFFIAVFLSITICCFNGYFYPVKYKEEIKLVAEDYNISPSLIAAVANVESGYNPNCKSNKGAVGVMQLLPSTAEWICEREKLEYKIEMLSDASYNLRLGGAYLSYLLSTFDNQQTALCAYNAGPGNVKGWLADKNYSSDGKKLDKIPFLETENYIIKINKNLHRYNKVYN